MKESISIEEAEDAMIKEIEYFANEWDCPPLHKDWRNQVKRWAKWWIESKLDELNYLSENYEEDISKIIDGEYER